MRIIKTCAVCNVDFGTDYYNKKTCSEDCKKQHIKSREKTGKLSSYLHGAEKRSIPFHLTFEQFISLWQKPCTYCGKEIKTIGIDRINNDIGYIIDNVTPCCSTCNTQKSNKTRREMIAFCKGFLNLQRIPEKEWKNSHININNLKQ